MTAPIVVAQATSAGAAAGSRSIRTIKVTKPQGDQAVTVQLGYEQNYKLDLSAIANEKITLVHIGEKLIILFDNKSTVTVEPFFDSMNAPLSNVTVEAAGRDFSSSDFASAFPITTDQSVLTAAGVSVAAGSPASGANFHGPGVDDLDTPRPLPLLGQEELPNWTITQLIGSGPAAEIPSNNLPSFDGELSGLVEEEDLNQEVILQPADAGNGNEDENSASGDDQDTSSDHTVTGHAVEVSLASLATGGDQPLTFEIEDVTADANPENHFVHDTNGARVTSFGADVSYVFFSTTLIEGWADGRLIFILELIDQADGTFRFTLNDQIDHPNHTVDIGSVSNGALEETFGLDLTAIVGGHDASGDPIALPNANMFTIGVIDDTPVAQIGMFEEGTLVVDETVPSGDEASDPFTYGTPLGVTTQTIVSAFDSNPGADLLGSSTHLSLEITNGNGSDSGLTTTDGTAIRLFLNGGIVEGRVDSSGDVAFAVSINDFGQVTVAQYLALRHPDFPDNFDEPVDLAGMVNAVVTVTDSDGDVATSSLDLGSFINFLDDGPVLNSDTNWVQQNGADASGNVLADQAHNGAPAGSFADVADAVGADGLGSVAWSGESSGQIVGLFGTLTVDANGNYTYALDNANSTVQQLANGDSITESFTYTMTDGDGDASSTTLTLTIFGSDHGVTITNLTAAIDGGDATVNEANLSDGSSPNNGALTQVGTFNISTPDGLDDLTVDGNAVITNGVFTATSFTTPLGNTLAITAFNAGTGQITYSYTLNDNEAHAAVQGTNSLFEDFTVVVSDTDGSTATDTLSVNIVDDVPIARDDFDSVSAATVIADGNVLTGVGGLDANGADGVADTAGADGMVAWTGSNGGSLIGQYGTISATSDGTYTYVLDISNPAVQNLANGQTLTETFDYTITDADDDVSAASLTITINGTDDSVTITNLTPQAQGGDVSVNENDLLASRGVGESDGSDTTKESSTQTGTFNISAPDGLDDLTVGGHAVITGGVFTATSFTTSLGNTLSITAFDAGTGQITYSYTLIDNEAHTPVQGTNSLFENFAVVLTDTDGSTTSDTLSVNIVDDVPTAANHFASAQEGSSIGTVDVVFIVDVSGSMSGFGADVGFNVPGFSDDRIGLARYSMQQLLANHPEIQNIQFTKFSDSASSTVWLSRADALTYINTDSNWNTGGFTNYDLALSTEMAAYNASTRPVAQGDQTVVYFLSDGEPNRPSGDPGITSNGAGSDVSIAEWESFLTTPANDISNVFAIGIGSGVGSAQVSNLEPISYPNTDAAAPAGDEDNVVIISSSNLGALTETIDDLLVNVVSSSGNVLTDGVLTTSFGADGGHILSIEINGTIYTWNGQTGVGAVITETGTINGTINGATSIAAATGLGGALTFYFAAGSGHNAGDWSYLSPANVSADSHDLFPYVIIDNDGDTSNAMLDITVTNVNHAPSITSNGGGATATISINENTTAVTDVNATDTDGDTLNYLIIGGADQGRFTINPSTGVLAFSSAPNFESPTDSDANNSYVVQVQVADGAGGIDTQTITVNVQDVNEAPSAGSDQVVSAAENVNDTTVLATVTGTDPDVGGGNDASNNFENFSYSIGGGNGSGLFEINSSGQISLAAGQHLDFETAQQHVLTVRVTDGPGLFDETQITINVTNVDEAPNAANDTVLTNINDPSGTEAFSIPLAALLMNDSDPEGAILAVQSVSESDSNFTATLDTPNGEVDVTDQTGGGTFTYTLGTTPAGGTDTANVTINRSQDGDTTLDGTDSGEILLGRNGSADTLDGNGGRDYLIGGSGNDTFDFNSTNDSGSTEATADVIADFVHGQDKIDLSSIDANTNVGGGGSGGQAFVWGGTSATANGVWYTESGGNTILSIDTNGNTASVEMMIVLTGIGKNLNAADFVL